MRNKVKLYIEGLPADLDDSNFLLFNYTAEDLKNPTIVKNSFSRQITLKGTPRNDAIFGNIYRNDRNTLYGSPYTGPYFDPTRKTSFVIYNEMNEILESGYLKLEEITTTRKRHDYKVTLFGGLGSFLYGLSYDSNGDKLSLADLDFGETLDFTIDRDTVAAAWQSLADDDQSGKWTIINFAPAYNGKPAKPFDAKKAIVHAVTAGLPDKVDEYTTQNGFSLVTLDSEVTEQESKDYRSYLQRPVIRLKNIIQAIFSYANTTNGWTVNLDPDFYDSDGAHYPYWAKTWLTLPLLNELNLDIVQTHGDDNFNGGTYTIPGGGNLSKLYTVRTDWAMVASGGAYDYVLHCEDDWAAGMSPDDSPGYYLNYLEFEVIAKDANDVVLKQFTWRVSTKQAPDYMPQMDEIFDYIAGGYSLVKDGHAWKPQFTIEDYGVAKVTVNMSIKGLAWGNLRAGADPNMMWPTNSYDYTAGEYFDCYGELQGSYIYYDITTSSTARTGATITKNALLSGSKTPAEYLLSFCKMFGMQIECNKDSKIVYIWLRPQFYDGQTIDLSRRIDRGREIVKKPFTFDARWYAWKNESKGDYADYYANKYGRAFGEMRVNTGYDFDADIKTMTDDIVFQGGCEVMETSKFFCYLGNGTIPAIFLGGGKYKLYKGGETQDYELPQLPSIARTWINSSNPMHDKFPLMQFHGADNGHIDERDTLLLFDGMYTAPDHTTLSDDTRDMLSLNGNSPCWMPGYCDYDNDWLLSSIPRFGRYLMSGSNAVLSLDWGDPLEVQIPGITIVSGSSIFARYWSYYISDRYDDDSAVVTAYVDLRGMRVDQWLLHNFYAFDGALWALNRIIDYSLTTPGPTKCEFVKVQDKTNYTSL